MPHIPHMRNKLNLILGALSIQADKDLAAMLGIRAQTLSECMSVRGDNVSEAVFKGLAQLLVDALPGRLTLEIACAALGANDIKLFQIAITPFPCTAFANLLEECKPTIDVVIRLLDADEGLGLQDPEPLIDPNMDRFPARAKFDLRIKGGRAGANVVVFAQSVLGCHLAVPRGDAPVVMGQAGVVHAPKGGIHFASEGGPYKFYAFLVETRYGLAPSIVARRDKTPPLEPFELDSFALELKDENRTTGFQFGCCSAFVEAAP